LNFVAFDLSLQIKVNFTREMNMKDTCAYYQAIIDKPRCWFFVAILRSYEHLAFDRTLDVTESRFEFFVPTDNENLFLNVMHLLEKQNLVTQLMKLPNRLAQVDV
jgi:hypothetical protein